MKPPLRVFRGLPQGLTDCPATGLAALLGGPSLVLLPGARNPPVLISVLLHGNETSGWNGLRRLLRQPAELDRSLAIFIGNVEAASAGQRTLAHQQDYNRIWRGACGAEGAIAAALMAALAGRLLFAAVDLHNNTGHNPHYSVLTDLTADNLALAYLFSDKAVYVREPDTVLTGAFAGRAPAVTLELGPIGDARADDRAFDYLRRLVSLAELDTADTEGLQLFQSDARVHVREGVDFGFAGTPGSSPLVLTGGVEAVNFHHLPAGTPFGTSSWPLNSVLQVRDPTHRDVTAEFFVQKNDRILLRRAVVPAMYTMDPVVIRQDCLCYFMSPLQGTPDTESGCPRGR